MADFVGHAVLTFFLTHVGELVMLVLERLVFLLQIVQPVLQHFRVDPQFKILLLQISIGHHHLLALQLSLYLRSPRVLQAPPPKKTHIHTLVKNVTKQKKMDINKTQNPWPHTSNSHGASVVLSSLLTEL